MRESSLVPCNLIDWLRCESLLPGQKFILLWLWSCAFLNCAGFGFIPIKGTSSSLSLSSESLLKAIQYLEEISLVTYDGNTGEVFINDWFRFHKFKTKPQINNFKYALGKLQSQKIKNVILEKSATYFATATITPTEIVAISASICAKKTKYYFNGVEVWTQDDKMQVQILVNEFGEEQIKEAVQIALTKGLQILPSIITKILKGQLNEKHQTAVSNGKSYYDFVQGDEN